MTILLSIVSGFATGIFLRSVLGEGWPVATFFVLLAIVCGGAAIRTPRRAYGACVFAFAFVALGMGRAWLSEGPPPPAFLAAVGHRVSYEGVVTSDPDLRDASARIAVSVRTGSAETAVLAVVPRTALAEVGDRVRVSGTLERPKAFADEDGRVFRYDAYLEKQGIRFLLSYGSIRVTRAAPWYSVPAALARAKHWFEGGLARALPEPYASLAGGIVIGGKSGLGKELQAAFVASGLVQVIVLSGYNVMVVADWVLAGLARTRLKRSSSAALAAAALLVFVGIAGFSATALRAALMAFIALYAKATGRSYAASRALLAVVFLMLLLNPLYLAFDPSFDLSVAATAGLIWLSSGLAARLGFVRNAFWREAIATTLAAQLAVLPLLLYETGTLSLVAIPANLLIAPFVPLAMAASAIAGIVGALLPPLAVFAGLPAYLAGAYLLAVARGAALVPYGDFALPAFPFALVVLAYAALVAIAASKRFSATVQLQFLKKASI